MKPYHNLAETRTPSGEKLSLHEHDGTYCIRLDGQDLMHSSTSYSELMLGDLAKNLIEKDKPSRVLIGGMGLGFTLKAVLDHAGPQTNIEVGELMEEVVEWNRSYMKNLNGRLLEDSRVSVVLGDVFTRILKAPANYYDAILMDVDNGPTPIGGSGNRRLYGHRGLLTMANKLKPGGRLAIWSASPEPSFEGRLRSVGFEAQGLPAKLYANAKRAAYVIYVGDKPKPYS